MTLPSRDEIANTSDENLDGLLLDALSVGDETPEQTYERIAGLSDGLRMLWSTWWVEGEVMNGGFNQFFWNALRLFAQEAVRRYRLLGADQHADLVERAIALNEAEAERFRPFRRARTLAAFSESYEHTDSYALDREFYALSDVSPLRARYIREHVNEFTRR